eukprot:ctg_607.g306
MDPHNSASGTAVTTGPAGRTLCSIPLRRSPHPSNVPTRDTETNARFGSQQRALSHDADGRCNSVEVFGCRLESS